VTPEGEGFLFMKQQKHAGCWVMPGSGSRGVFFHMPDRPNWWHRLWMRAILGFKWEDAK
jgi:hypothetical protein